MADYYQTEFPRFAKRAQVLGTVSEYSRHDLATTYGLDGSAIEVFSNAADEEFQPASLEGREGARRTLSEGRPYFIFVGSLHPRKNVEGLMSAFESYRALGGSWDLVVVGVRCGATTCLRFPRSCAPMCTSRALEQRGFACLAGAEGLVFVPWFEGFGIPVVEAMACGVPVISSNGLLARGLWRCGVCARRSYTAKGHRP